MDNQEIKNKIKELEEELSRLKEELNKPENKVFKPKIGDIYYCIICDGEVLKHRWNGDIFDIKRYVIGNCFETEKEAEFEIERLKVIAELKRFAEEHNEPIEWGKRENVYSFLFDHLRKKLIIDFTIDFQYNNIYFSSKELAKQAIKEIGEDRIKKYYLGVEDKE